MGDFVQNAFEEKFSFIESFKLSLSTLERGGEPLEFKAVVFGKERVLISSTWFSPFVPYIKGGLSVLFWVLTALTCYRNIANVFGAGVTKAGQGIYTGNRNEGS